MQIINNNVRQQNLSKLSQNRNYNSNVALRNNMGATDTVSFQGVSKLDPRNLKKMNPYIKTLLKSASTVLDVTDEEVSKSLSGKSKPQKEFFALLTDNYNRNNFYSKPSEKENPELVMELVDKVKFPQRAHLKMAQSSYFSVTDASKSMKKLDYDPSKISKFHKIAQDLRDFTPENKETTMSILDAKNKDEIIDNYKTYRPYLKLNIGDKDCVKNLDEQIEKGTYDVVGNQKRFGLMSTISDSSLRDVVDVEEYLPHYSKEGNKILEKMVDKLSPRNLKDKENYKQNLAEIYKTTTKENVGARTSYLNTYMRPYTGVTDYKPDEMDNVVKLFRKMDEDKKVMKFIDDISIPKTNTVGAEGYLKVVESVPEKKRDLYKSNIANILASGESNSSEKAVKFCAIQSESPVKKAVKGVKNYLHGLFTELTPRQKEYAQSRSMRRSMNAIYRVSDIPKSATLDSIQKEQERQASLPAVIYKNPKLDLTKPAYPAVSLPKLSEIVGKKNTFKFNIPSPVGVEKKSKVNTLPTVVYNPNLTVSKTSAKDSSVLTDEVNVKKKNH
jgi:hypothetical protein